MDKLVSVIILTWNRVALLKETVSSVLGQTYQNFEILIIDNESTDDTADYVSGLSDTRVKYFRHPNRGILSVNRNFGIGRAGGDYIAFCDDDDLWLADKLEKQMDWLRQHPKYKIVSANAIYFDDKGDIDSLIKKRAGMDLTLDDFLKGKNDVVLPSVLINKEVFSEIGPYNEDPRIINTEDYEFMVRAAAHEYPIFFINECLVKYRIHGGMTSHANTLTTVRKEQLFFRNLYNQKTLNQVEFRAVSRNLRKIYIIAVVKELLKKIGMKNAIYFFRRLRLKRHTPDDRLSSWQDGEFKADRGQ